MEEPLPQLQRLEDGRLALVGEAGTITAEFVTGPMGFRRTKGGGRGQAVAKAVGLKGGRPIPRVVDLTAGLGRDAFILATLGCPVLALERHPDIHALCADGLERALEDAETAEMLEGRLQLLHLDALTALQSWDSSPLASFTPDVLYLDPMHPPRKKSALPRKEMRLFRALVGEDLDQTALLEAALAAPVQRVVVKRPAQQPPLLEGATSAVTGKTTRFDIYLP
ncbi:MAG: class I SAM-dependent methyltransferase [Planctomycetota bacterium]